MRFLCPGIGFVALCTLLAGMGHAQTAPAIPTVPGGPLAIVPVEGVKLVGALEIAEGKAVIAASGSVTAGEHAATITLPRRGNLRICPTTKVSLTADSSVRTNEAPGLMLALDRGALEANFATGPNSDVILTPDFRIIISGPGTAQVQVRLGARGDTCVDNHGPNPPYVSVSSVFEGGVYRVQANQRVMFQGGSLRAVIDEEKEPCGCPPETPASPTGNQFPLAQSEGLAPLPTPPPNASAPGTVNAQITAQLSAAKAKEEAALAPPPAPQPAPAPTAKPAAKGGFLRSLGHFFRRIFGG